MFSKIAPEHNMYLWNIYTLTFVLQCRSVVLYWAMLVYSPHAFIASSTHFGVIMIVLCIQSVYILHDVIHGATFPPYEWQNYITHPFSDFVSLPWMDIIMEHNKHHNSTFDLLNHCEFGWDPAEWFYFFQLLR